MFDPIITYELGKAVQDSYLKDAEQARLIKTLKGTTAPVGLQKWFWRFKIKNLFTARRFKDEKVRGTI